MASTLVSGLYGGSPTLAANLAGVYDPGVQTGKYATYLKLFSGELFKAYQNQTIARELCTRRTLKSGKSMQFIFTGGLSAYYHVPGSPILGATADGGSTANQMPVGEKTIVMDDLLVASTFVYDLDEMLAHYDLRGEMARKIGYALANSYDQKIFRTVAKASQEGRAVAGQQAGCRIEIGYANRAGQATHSAKLVDAFYAAAQRFDETNIPSDGRVAVLPPASYYNLITQVSNNIINRDEVGDALQGGDGVYSIAGIRILKSNNLPTSNTAVTHTDGENNDYTFGANQNLQALIMHKDSVGCVEAIGPQVQTTSGDVSVMYQGDLIVGRMAMGAGTLNPAGAVAIHAGGATGSAAGELSATTQAQDAETAGVVLDIA